MHKCIVKIIVDSGQNKSVEGYIEYDDKDNPRGYFLEYKGLGRNEIDTFNKLIDFYVNFHKEYPSLEETVFKREDLK